MPPNHISSMQHRIRRGNLITLVGRLGSLPQFTHHGVHAPRQGHRTNFLKSVVKGTCADLRNANICNCALAAMQLGRGALLAKTDIKAAYRLIPVHPSDRVHAVGNEIEQLNLCGHHASLRLSLSPEVVHCGG